MARLVAEEGLHLDVATGGELHVALQAGLPAERVVFHGNNKSDAELRLALELGVGRIVVDSFDELDRIEALVAAGGPAPRVLVRVTPGRRGAHARVHRDRRRRLEVRLHRAERRGPRRRAAGGEDRRHATSPASTATSGRRSCVLESFAVARGDRRRAGGRRRPRRTGAPVDEINLGGGLGVPYTADDARRAVDRRVRRRACARRSPTRARRPGSIPRPRLTVEAGRSIAGPAGITLYTVGTIKEIPGVRTYVAVDGGMSDNPRPATYGARVRGVPPGAGRRAAAVRRHRGGQALRAGRPARRATRTCPPTSRSATCSPRPVTGAYGYSMASNYNLVPRPAVVFVRDGDARVVVRRETLDDLVARDVTEREGD